MDLCSARELTRYFSEPKKKTATVQSDPGDDLPQVDEATVETLSDQVRLQLASYTYS